MTTTKQRQSIYNRHVIDWLARQYNARRITYNGPGGTVEALGIRVCPACGAKAVYSPPIDRYLHADGSANDRCWVRTVRGDTPYMPPAVGWQWET